MKLSSFSHLIVTLALIAGAQNALAAQKKTARSSKTSVAQNSAQSNSNQQIDASKDIDGLGGNEALYNMATSIDPDNRSRIVQQRIVDRHNRFEFGLNYGYVAGGDSYLQTQSLGGSVDFHFTPRVSLGVRYYDYTNNLTPEGKRVFNQAREDYAAGRRATVVDLDTPQNAVMGIVTWYPIYGKTNLLNWGIAQFDMYLLGGGGTIQLSSGSTGIYTGGAGVGFWISKHVSARAEVRYQTYQDQLITGSRTLQETVANIGMGILL